MSEHMWLVQKVYPWSAIRSEATGQPLTDGDTGSFGVVLAFRTREAAEAFAPGVPVEAVPVEFPALYRADAPTPEAEDAP